MRDRSWCGNCDRPREVHYKDDGSWNDALEPECPEYDGVTPRPDDERRRAAEIKKARKESEAPG